MVYKKPILWKPAVLSGNCFEGGCKGYQCAPGRDEG